MAKKYAVEFTVQEIVALRDLVVQTHSEQTYYAERRLDEAEDRWLKDSINGARKRQAAMSDLHVALIGEPLEPAEEKAPTPVDADA